MVSTVILALDVGTSSLRTMLYDATGAALPGIETQVTHTVQVTPDGGVVLDPALLLANTIKAIDGVLAQAPRDVRIAGVATSTLWHSILGLDEAGKPLTPLYTWADTRAASAAATLRKQLDERAFHQRTGCMLRPAYPVARLFWLSQTQPDLWKRVVRWVSFGEFLQERLLGHTICSYSMASGTGLLDVHRLTWDDEVLGATGLDPGHLSPLGDASEQAGVLSPEWASRWPALDSVPWFPALGDGACSNIGSGCIAPDRIALMVGTSSAIRVLIDATDTAVPPDLWCYRVDRKRLLVGGALSEGGNVLAWMRSTLRLDDLAKLDGELAALEPDAHGLTVLPFLAGERSPHWAAEARGAIDGLTLATRPIDILRAAMEAIAYRFALIHRSLALRATPDAFVVASGGALLGSPTWMAIMADVLSCRIAASGEREASSRGAALLAAEALGLLRDVADAPVELGPSYEPDPARHARYLAAIDRQAHLYSSLVAAE